MTRSEFLRATSSLACASCATAILGSRAAAATAPVPAPPSPDNAALKEAQAENEFTNHWLTDLFDAIASEVEPAVQLRLLQACGRGCYRRHQFKQDLAAAGRGDAEKLIAAYRKFFGVERRDDLVFISYSDHCFCPAARHRPARPNDVHCECTRATHQTIFETALGRPIKVELLETIRRGGSTCRLVAHLA